MIAADDKITAICLWIVYEPHDAGEYEPHDTVMVGRRVLGPLRGYVVDVANEKRLKATFVSPEGAKTFLYLLRTEGVWWIRGHHAEDSPEVIAMLAAHALLDTGAVLL